MIDKINSKYHAIINPDIVIDNDVADVIKLIFNLYEQGNGVTKIAQILNEKGIPTPTKYKISKRNEV